MKHFAHILGVCCLLAGCRNPAAQELLERDLRLQEDRIYELEALVEKYECNACDKGAPSGKTLRSEFFPESDSGSDPAPRPGGVELPPGIDEPSGPLKPPSVERPPGSEASRDEAPQFLPSSRSKNHGGIKSTGPSGGKSNYPRLGPAEGEPWQDGDFEIPIEEEAKKPRTKASPASLGHGKAERITLDADRTRSRNRDGKSGDEGLDVVVQPRDAQGRLLRPAGSVSIVVLDPTFSGPQARVARWDFAAKDIVSLASTQRPEEGLLLELDWPGTPPHNRTLNLYVRYLTPEGRELRTEQQVDVSVVGGKRTWERAAPQRRPIQGPRERDEEWEEDRNEAPREARRSYPEREPREDIDVAAVPLRVRLPAWSPNR